MSLQPYYVSTLPAKTKIAQNGRLLTVVRSVEPIVPNSQKVVQFSIRFFPGLLNNFFGSLLAENSLHSHGFLSEIYLQTQYG